MNKSESIKNLAVSLGKFHEEMGKIVKDETNPFFKSKYAPLPDVLSAIKEPLAKAGLVFTQFPDGLNQLSTLLIDTASGEFIEATYEMTPAKNDPQGQGSVITYQRRYALGAILGLNIDEDDDGNKASIPPRPAPVTKAPVNLLGQVKVQLTKKGAKDADEALQIINQLTGLEWTDLEQGTDADYQLILAKLLGA